MGSTESKSTIDNSVKQDIDVKFSVGNTLADTQFCNSSIFLKNCTIKGDANLTNKCRQSKILSATQTSNIGATTSNTLAQNLTSAAEAEGQNVNLNPGDISAESVVSNYTNLTSSISTSVQNQIKSLQSSSQTVGCIDTNILGDATILNDSEQTSAANAVQNSTAVAEAAQELSQTISSTSKAVQKDAIGSLALLIIAYAVLGAVGVWGLSKLAGYLIYIGIIVLIAGLAVGFFLLKPVYSSSTKGTEPCFSPEKRCLSAGPKDSGTNMLQNPCCVVPDGKGVGNKEGPAACIRLRTVFRQALIKFNPNAMYDITNQITRNKPIQTQSVSEQVTATLVPLAELPIPPLPPSTRQIISQNGQDVGEIQRILKVKNTQDPSKSTAIGIIVKMLDKKGEKVEKVDFVNNGDLIITGGDGGKGFPLKWTMTTDAIRKKNGNELDIEIKPIPRKPANSNGCYEFDEQATCPLGCEWSRPRMGVPRDYANSMCADNKSALSTQHCAWVNEDSASGSLQNIPVQKGECEGKARTQAPDAPLGCSMFRAIGVGKK